MNHITLIGRLAKDPELRYTPGGSAVCNFSLAVPRPFTNQAGEKEADFINITVWNKQGESAAKYLSKGRQVAIEGRVQNRSYEDKNGQKRWVTEVIAERVEFLGSKPADNNQQQNVPGNNTKEGPYDNFGQEIAFNENDIPF